MGKSPRALKMGKSPERENFGEIVIGFWPIEGTKLEYVMK
jgi:hypothetical protein